MIGSDITFFEPALPALMRTLRQVVENTVSAAGADHHSTKVLLAHSRRRRGGEDALFEALRGAGLEAHAVHENTDPDVVIVECTRGVALGEGESE